MCMAVPMRVLAVNGVAARCEARGAERSVNLAMLMDESVAVGDILAVHLGSALYKMSAEEADAAWALYDEMLGLAERR